MSTPNGWDESKVTRRQGKFASFEHDENEPIDDLVQPKSTNPIDYSVSSIDAWNLQPGDMYIKRDGVPVEVTEVIQSGDGETVTMRTTDPTVSRIFRSDHGVPIGLLRKVSPDEEYVTDGGWKTYECNAEVLSVGDYLVEDHVPREIKSISRSKDGELYVVRTGDESRAHIYGRTAEVTVAERESVGDCPLCHQPIDYCQGHGEFNSSEEVYPEKLQAGDLVWDEERGQAFPIAEIRSNANEIHAIGPDHGRRLIFNKNRTVQCVEGPHLKSDGTAFTRPAVGPTFANRVEIIENRAKLQDGRPAYMKMDYYGTETTVSGWIKNEWKGDDVEVSLVDDNGREIANIYSHMNNNLTNPNVKQIRTVDPAPRNLDEDGYFERSNAADTSYYLRSLKRGEAVRVTYPDGTSFDARVDKTDHNGNMSLNHLGVGDPFDGPRRVEADVYSRGDVDVTPIYK